MVILSLIVSVGMKNQISMSKDCNRSPMPILDAGETVKINQTGAVPKNTNQPIHIEIDVAEHFFTSNPKIIEKTKIRPAFISQLNTRKRYRTIQKSNGQSIAISLNEEAATAEVPSAEFIPNNNPMTVSENFDSFFEAIIAMNEYSSA